MHQLHKFKHTQTLFGHYSGMQINHLRQSGVTLTVYTVAPHCSSNSTTERIAHVPAVQQQQHQHLTQIRNTVKELELKQILENNNRTTL